MQQHVLHSVSSFSHICHVWLVPPWSYLWREHAASGKSATSGVLWQRSARLVFVGSSRSPHGAGSWISGIPHLFPRTGLSPSISFSSPDSEEPQSTFRSCIVCTCSSSVGCNQQPFLNTILVLRKGKVSVKNHSFIEVVLLIASPFLVFPVPSAQQQVKCVQMHTCLLRNDSDFCTNN